MKKQTLIFLLIISSFLLNLSTLSAQRLVADEYVKIIGRGIAMSIHRDDFYPNTLSTLKNDGMDHIRLRCQTPNDYADNFTDPQRGFDNIEFAASKIIDAGLVPIVAWSNPDAQLQGLNWQMDNFVAWWTEIATRMKNLPNNDNIAFDLIIELGNDDAMGSDRVLFNDVIQQAVTAIRNVDPNRIIIIPSPSKEGFALYDIDLSIFADEYMMAEFHSYAAGPHSTEGSEREWSDTGSVEDRQRVLNQFADAVAWRGETGIPLYFGAWMPMGNKDFDYGIEDVEAQSFARFFMETFEYYRIPGTLNAIQHFYDEDAYGENQGDYVYFKNFPDENGPLLDMQALYSIVTTHANLLWQSTPTKYSLSVTNTGTGTGTVSLSPDGDLFYAGTVVSLTASADAGSSFIGWSGDLNSGNSLESVTLESDKNIFAQFDLITGPTTDITLNPTDDSYVRDNYVNTNYGTASVMWIDDETDKIGFVKFDLSGISDPIISATLELTGKDDATGGNVSVYSIADDNWDETTITYNNAPAKGTLLGYSSLGTPGTVYSIDVSGFVISEKSGDNIVSLLLNDHLNNNERYDFYSKEAGGDLVPKLIVTVSSGSTITYDLTTSAINGTVTPESGTFNEGQVITLTATPDAGYEFAGWSGDITGMTNPVDLTMDGDKNITANFTALPVYNLTVSIVGNGTVTPMSGSYAQGTVVTLTATPDVDWQFDSWSGDATGTSTTTTVTMDSDKNVTATFTQNTGGEFTTDLIPADDSYIDANKTSKNYGDVSDLDIKNHTKNQNGIRITYIKFDLSNIGTVSSAILNLTTVNRSGLVDILEVTDDSWGENSITWNNAPATGNVIASVDLNGSVSIDITSYIASEASGDNYASIALVTSGNTELSISSKEGAATPQLTVTHDGVPKGSENAISHTNNEFAIYPNPSTGIVNIAIANEEFTNGIVKIISSYGSTLEIRTITNQETNIDLQDYDSGLYYVTITYGGKTNTQSLIIK